ncbi:bifunctional diaminohydroxyphosphoribosylaminopyrimidine deaminase/5-amino-6-(5-phosphoribosylamino)uracil reductase RibD [Thermolongibacillus altinsuensis]|jgi:diaminohydroxyphosphoribosylaminopyrimidine deaminase/5-amino-6-(5-phosphoribosylamino)uracil reductase|uniref:bifunctional diaminohydroxyphosphoribosylaminopyrimidine deaminase/5-amino-6-(5-phosphoribosylamino)uracil reductase RibD n=1 Tax=Thermolongibacillus altinsuensis TaxID=575256 RepID=UPI00242A3188|nr:bifunctional diaminohydroxyphosphoribosylaminopyrimidine deaminase/5-amino-6-(5-phosphoribosylamino)uracil reductase RibD [Thermolongibacillus altinsuensis]GMB07792.1 riboflavin biosynthesis protein RibD [Thermolongibacillus altinsuensis]
MNDEQYMRFALQLAQAAVGQTSPNPVVGAVVVKDGEIVGFGAHLKAGEPHAEVHALRMAGEKAKGATVYVTLEPCSHYGKTPPCADLLIEKEVRRVVVATTDPNPLVAGKGIAKLRQAGIAVDVGVLKEEADELNEMFFHYISTKTPYVTLKYAMSLDGKIATKTGESKWITSEEARRDVHRYRRAHDAILVGVETVLADDPSLTVRLGDGGKNPIRIILDTRLRTPLEAKVVRDGETPTWIVVGSEVTEAQMAPYREKNVQIIQMNEASITIPSLLKVLGEKKVMSLFVEGGAAVHGSFVAAKAFQKVIAYIAPKFIGGKEAPSPIGGSGFAHMAEVMSLQIKQVETIGPDIKIVAKG